jgi:hypothetical protein
VLSLLGFEHAALRGQRVMLRTQQHQVLDRVGAALDRSMMWWYS